MQYPRRVRFRRAEIPRYNRCEFVSGKELGEEVGDWETIHWSAYPNPQTPFLSPDSHPSSHSPFPFLSTSLFPSPHHTNPYPNLTSPPSLVLPTQKGFKEITHSKFLVHIPLLTPLSLKYNINSSSPGCGFCDAIACCSIARILFMPSSCAEGVGRL